MRTDHKQGDMVLGHKFVGSIPKRLKNRTLYISTSYNTVLHKCCCGCGEEVVTPISPTDWRLTYDGKSISLYPSIGNWSFDCQSHYWIRNSTVKWAGKWSKRKIENKRKRDRFIREKLFLNRGRKRGRLKFYEI